MDYIHRVLEGNPSICVHKECRQTYTRPSSIAASKGSTDVPNPCHQPVSLRSSENLFDYKTNCVSCGKPITEIGTKTPKQRRMDVRLASTLEVRESLLKTSESRNDKWGEKVKAHLLSVSDLVAPEARYHVKCLFF